MMKPVAPSILATCMFLLALIAGCGGGSSNYISPPPGVQGNWTVTTADDTNGDQSKLQATLVSSPCSVTTPIGTFTVQGPVCVIADNNTGQGSVTGTGDLFYPPQGVLMGVNFNPPPANSSLDLLFVEADSLGNVAVFDGVGIVNNEVITGTWTCNVNSPGCAGLSGTFTATHSGN
jgi:hypothetical protein